MPSSAGTLAEFHTVFGDIGVELFDQEKPVSVANFKKYVEDGLYQNMFFHRWISGFVVQGGGFVIQNRGATNAAIGDVPTLGNITNETHVGPLESNQYGTIAMARSTDANSASSQFYFNLGDNSSLDTAPNGGYAVFGKMVYGSNVLNRFVTTGKGVFHYKFKSPFEDLPTISTNTPSFNNFQELVFVDVSLLTAQIHLTRGGRLISWNGAAGVVNRVEFSTNAPPQWQTLTNVAGTGSTMQIVDVAATNEFRFYRVTVVP
jgi:cyclophilin family peptidyl-prolyl cis-trans isomerase